MLLHYAWRICTTQDITFTSSFPPCSRTESCTKLLSLSAQVILFSFSYRKNMLKKKIITHE
jgi:hypothetical protein